MPSIFSKIIAGEIPCEKVFEDEYVFAFLDIRPLAPGHTLVVPKREVERLDQMTPDEAAALGRVLPELGRRIVAAVGAAGYNVLQNNGEVAGQEVPHVHVHLIPRQANDGLGYCWKPQQVTPEALAEVAQRIRTQA